MSRSVRCSLRRFARAGALVAIAWFAVPEGMNALAQNSSYQSGDLGGPEKFATEGFGPSIHVLSCAGSETALLIQDVIPWFAPGNQDPNGAIVTELKARGKFFCIINSNEIGITDLSQFKEIIIAAAQTQTFYDNLFPGGSFHPDLTDWVHDDGGILLALLTDNASGPGANGAWDGNIFISGVQHVTFLVNDNNCVDNNCADVTHPIIAGQFGGANGGQITDSGTFNDLDGWGQASHGYFTSLPSEVRIILTQPDVTSDTVPEPVLIQYSFGEGWVIATLTTTEWRYVGNFGSLPQNRKLLANLIGFQTALASLVRPMDQWIVSSEFGENWICDTNTLCDPSGRRPFKHVGVDVNPGAATEEVLAAATGVVRQCVLTAEFGWVIVLEAPIADAQITTVYWHVTPAPRICPRGTGRGRGRSPVATGIPVGKGEPIATVAPLRSITPHLHFGMRLAPFDPPVSLRGALPPEGAGGCTPCASRTDTTPLPAFPASFVDPQIFFVGF